MIFVDEEGEPLVRRAPGPIVKRLQHPWPHLVGDGAVLCDRSNALDEVLVRVALMKRHELKAIPGLVLVSRQVIVLEAIRLSSTRRAVENGALRCASCVPIDDSDFRVAREKPARADETIWTKAEERFGDRTPLSEGYVVTRAKIAVKLARRPGGNRRRTLALTIPWPHGCDLKDRTATEQMIGEKYLRRWGILVDDLQLFED
ncbi:hypothetical protein ACFHYO_14170 [Paracoccus panacisoli]|uniref:Uncharacterized protein n=1 Tax=Paracoccus panacisoli TaxID=1510163 RepID=A0ABV6T7K1_9RHOB